jgi:signal transduction histidine kinase
MLHRRTALPDRAWHVSTLLSVTLLVTVILALVWVGTSLAQTWPLTGWAAVAVAAGALVLLLIVLVWGQLGITRPAAVPTASSAPSDSSTTAPSPDTLGPVLLRLCEALPGPALLVHRASLPAAWQLAYLNSAARSQVQVSWSGAPALASWLEQIPAWPREAMLQALTRPQDLGTSAPAASAVAHVLPVDTLTAILWLPQPPPKPPERSPSERDSVIYTISHDLRAPIRVIEGFARIVREDYGAALDRVGNDHLERILGAAARMNSMIDTILALSKLSSQPLARQPVNLSLLAEQVLEELRRQAPERTLEASISPGLSCHGDPTLLRMLLDNLLGNAWKYSARCAVARIEFGQQLQDGRQVYLVRDNGAGFDMRFAERLFNPFQRLHSASEFAGTGIGLASVKRIVERHGGQIWAEAEVDKGATFYFTLG